MYVKYQVIGQNHVAVPTHFFKIVVTENNEGNLEMEAYVLPNKAIENGTPLHIFQVKFINIKMVLSHFRLIWNGSLI